MRRIARYGSRDMTGDTKTEAEAILAAIQTLGATIDHATEMFARTVDADSLSRLADVIDHASTLASGLLETMGRDRLSSTSEAGTAAIATAFRSGLIHARASSLEFEDVVTISDEDAVQIAMDAAAQNSDAIARAAERRLSHALREITRIYAEDVEILLAHTTPPADRLGLIQDYVRKKLPKVADEIAASITKTK